jgi:hypothetical protein
MAIVRGQVQRRAPARPTAAGTRPAHSMADSPQAQTAHLPSSWAFTSALASTSDRIIRRLPLSAAQCSAVQPSLCTAGPGCGGGPHGCTPVPNRYPNTKQQARPEGRPRFRCGTTLTVESTPGGLGVLATSHPARASTKRWQTSESRGNGDCGRRRRREITRLGKTAGERTSHGT